MKLLSIFVSLIVTLTPLFGQVKYSASTDKTIYQLPVAEFVTLKVYDVFGREVAALVKEYQNTGMHFVIFDAAKLSSGVYFYRLEAGTYSETKKLLYLK